MTVTNSYLEGTNSKCRPARERRDLRSNNTAGACRPAAADRGHVQRADNCGNLYVKGVYSAEPDDRPPRTTSSSEEGTTATARVAATRCWAWWRTTSSASSTRSTGTSGCDDDASRLDQQRHDRRRDPHAAALLHGRQPRLWQPARHAHGQRRDRAEVPRRGRHVRRTRRHAATRRTTSTTTACATARRRTSCSPRTRPGTSSALRSRSRRARAPRAAPAVPCDPAPAGSFSLSGWTKCRLEQGLSRPCGVPIQGEPEPRCQEQIVREGETQSHGTPGWSPPGCHRRW